MIDLIHAHQPRRELEHVIPQRDDDELRILRPLLDVRRYDRDLPEEVMSVSFTSSGAMWE